MLQIAVSETIFWFRLCFFGSSVSRPRPSETRRHHFNKYGSLADIALMKDKYTGHPRGFGFIKFEDLTGATMGWQRAGSFV